MTICPNSRQSLSQITQSILPWLLVPAFHILPLVHVLKFAIRVPSHPAAGCDGTRIANIPAFFMPLTEKTAETIGRY